MLARLKARLKLTSLFLLAVQQAANPTPLPGCPAWSLPSCWPRQRTLLGHRVHQNQRAKVSTRERNIHHNLDYQSFLYYTVILSLFNTNFILCFLTYENHLTTWTAYCSYKNYISHLHLCSDVLILQFCIKMLREKHCGIYSMYI